MPLRNEEYMRDLVARWAAARCTDFGEGGAQHLYESFKSWVYETRAMRRFPGQIAFGMAMRAAGYEKRKVRGLTYWAGISIKPKAEDV
jgi:hypothetical protein